MTAKNYTVRMSKDQQKIANRIKKYFEKTKHRTEIGVATGIKDCMIAFYDKVVKPWENKE
jgi:hypothetical protein